MLKRIGILLLVTIMLVLSGCSLFTPMKMEISPISVTLLTGQSQDFSAKAMLPSGSEILQHNFIWEMSGDIGSLSTTTGYTTVFTAAAEGSCILTVLTFDRKVFASANIVVKEPSVLSSIVVEPSVCNLEDGGTREFVARGFDQYSDPFAFTPNWSLTGSIGSLSTSSGSSTVLTAANPGPDDVAGSVVASMGAVSGAASVTVNAPPSVLTSIEVAPASRTLTDGESCEFTATCYDQYMRVFPVNPQWTVQGAIGGLSSISGFSTVLTADNPSSADISGSVIASSGSISGSAAVTVKPGLPALARIEVTTDKNLMLLGETCNLTAIGYDQYGDPFPVDPLWSSAGSKYVDLNATFAPTQGSATNYFPGKSDEIKVRATSGTISGEADVSVLPIKGSYAVHFGTYWPILDNNISTFIYTSTEANPKAIISEGSRLFQVSGDHTKPEELSISLEAKDSDGSWRMLPDGDFYLDPSGSPVFDIFFQDLTGLWNGVPLKTDYRISIRDGAINNTGYVKMIFLLASWTQYEL